MYKVTHTRDTFEQHIPGPAVNRIRRVQSHQIQWPTLQWRVCFRRIFQTALCLLLASEVYTAVGQEPPTVYSTNGTLITDASGYRANGTGGLTNMGSNGNYWVCAPNSQTNARNLNFNSGGVYPLNNNNRSNGFSVRPCRAFDKAACCVCFSSSMRYTFKQVHYLVTVAYIKARAEERDTPAQLEFELNLEHNLKLLARELYFLQWYPQPLDWFVHLDPTVREVFAPKFRDRIVSHVLFMMLSPVFERFFIYDSHSCRVGKGTLEGIERFEHNIRSVTNNYTRDAYCLNMDISGYFMSMVRSKLYEIIWATLGPYQRRFPDAMDYRLADYLITTFLSRDPLEGCVYHGDPKLIALVPPSKSLRFQKPGVGVPIGDVINQLNSNIYMTPFDQFVKRVLKVPYDRYVDDGKELDQSRDYLVECWERSGEFLDKELCLTLHPNKTTITSLYDTNYFLGAAILPYRRYAKNGAVGRFRAYIESVDAAIATGEPLDYPGILSRINSRLGYLQHFDEIKIIEKTINATHYVREAFAFTKDYKKAIIKPITK